MEPPRYVGADPSRDDVLDRSGITSSRTLATVASVHDSDYEQKLALRNIYIDCGDPPAELIQRARGIITHPQPAPELDSAIAHGLVQTVRKLRSENEATIIGELAVLTHGADRLLEMSASRLWSNSVAVPLRPGTLISPLGLPNPKPDRAFGYSQSAFTDHQLGAIDLLVDEFGKSYAMPDENLRFPFLSVEFKSQANGGTHYTATNQVAGAGAIALHGYMELMRRSCRVHTPDINEPLFFSATIDHELARINAHWLKGGPSEDRPYSFHVEAVAKYLLDNEEGLRATKQAIQNILCYSLDRRLKGICEAIDEYREIFVAARDAAITK
jgi:hypothetical protein